MSQIIEPGTERIQLRQWKESDRLPFAAMSSDPKVMEYFPSILSRSESDAIVDKCQSLPAERGWGVWAVELLETKEFIGIIGLHVPSAELPIAGTFPHHKAMPAIRIGIQFFKIFSDACPYRVEMNITYQFKKIRIILAHYGFVAILKEMPPAFMSAVIRYCMTCQ